MIKHLWPFNTYSSPTATAVLRHAPASEPASGSVRAKAEKPPDVTTSAKCLRCASVPAIRRGFMPSPFAPTLSAKPASPQDSSSRTIHAVTLDIPGPPYSSGRSRQLSCILHAVLYKSKGNSPERSNSLAMGRTSFSAKECTNSLISSCSAVKIKRLHLTNAEPIF